VRDVCAACLDRREALAAGTILNLCSGQARRIGDVLDELLALAGVTVEVRTDRSRVPIGDVRCASRNAARMRTRALLGWVPEASWGKTRRDVLGDWRARIATERQDS
jgi:GDP-4-dehydro-6-deoxy-D-mannose reductase